MRVTEGERRGAGAGGDMLEFQAVVMAGGRGSRLPDLPGSPPKGLLPVGPYPLLYYPLAMLERQGFQEAMLVVLDVEKTEIQNALDKCGLKIKIEYVTIQAEKDWGTADSLRHIHDRIITDIIVVSCDFVSDVNLDVVLDIFRKHDASAVTLFFNNGPAEYIQIPGPKTKDKPERDLVGIDKETNRLVFLASASDYEDVVSLPRTLLTKHPVLSLQSRLLDSHVYVLKKWVVDFLVNEQHFTTVKGELLPYIIKKQLSKPVSPHCDDRNASLAGVDVNKDVFRYVEPRGFDQMIRKMSTYNDHTSGTKACYHNDLVRCYAHIPPKESYAIRVNTLSAYCLINSKIIKKWEDITHGAPLTRFHPHSDVKSKQVDDDSIVGDQSHVSEKTSIKGTIIGCGCKIENKVRITNCILMNNVTIKEGCSLQDCIIYSGAIVEEDCSLKLCLVGPKHKVPAKTTDCMQIFAEINENVITLG